MQVSVYGKLSMEQAVPLSLLPILHGSISMLWIVVGNRLSLRIGIRTHQHHTYNVRSRYRLFPLRHRWYLWLNLRQIMEEQATTIPIMFSDLMQRNLSLLVLLRSQEIIHPKEFCGESTTDKMESRNLAVAGDRWFQIMASPVQLCFEYYFSNSPLIRLFSPESNFRFLSLIPMDKTISSDSPVTYFRSRYYKQRYKEAGIIRVMRSTDTMGK